MKNPIIKLISLIVKIVKIRKNKDMEITKINNPYIELYKSSSTTATDRFNACKRLTNLDRASMHAMTFASIALIIISIISIGNFKNIKIPEDLNDIVSLVQTCLPILLLAISINISSANYGAKAQRMHDSAKNLNNFSKIIYPYSKNEEWEKSKYETHCQEYANIIDKYENHDDVDHERTKRNKKINLIRKNLGVNGIYLHIQIADLIFKNGKIFYFYYATIIFSLIWVTVITFLSYKTILC